MTRFSTLRLIAGLIAGSALGACYSSPQPVVGVAYGTYEPPLTPVEVIPTSPGLQLRVDRRTLGLAFRQIPVGARLMDGSVARVLRVGPWPLGS